MGDLSEHFSRKEFYSDNDKGKTFKTEYVRPELLMTLEAIREAIGKPITVTSGVRSVEHNAGLSGSSPASAHLYGAAADIAVSTLGSQHIAECVKRLVKEGKLPYLAYTYVISKTAVHVGVDQWTKRTSMFGKGY
jgi:uncharacterized protein YcbK (DUF882 family)